MELDEALDFLSPNFDPAKALQATHLELPCPEVEVYIYECSKILLV